MDVTLFEFMVFFGAILLALFVGYIGFFLESMLNWERDNVPKFRRKLLKSLKEYGIENEIKDEMVMVTKKGWNIRLVFSKGRDGNVDVKLQAGISLNDFNIDGWGELVIEHQLNNFLVQGQAIFVDRKQLFIQSFESFRRVDSLMKVLDSYIDIMNQIHVYLYDNKQRIEADFGEKEQEQNARKIGF
jgi:hypothetical protein